MYTPISVIFTQYRWLIMCLVHIHSMKTTYNVPALWPVTYSCIDWGIWGQRGGCLRPHWLFAWWQLKSHQHLQQYFEKWQKHRLAKYSAMHFFFRGGVGWRKFQYYMPLYFHFYYKHVWTCMSISLDVLRPTAVLSWQGPLDRMSQSCGQNFTHST